jgi:hypothetical protein
MCADGCPTSCDVGYSIPPLRGCRAPSDPFALKYDNPSADFGDLMTYDGLIIQPPIFGHLMAYDGIDNPSERATDLAESTEGCPMARVP